MASALEILEGPKPAKRKPSALTALGEDAVSVRAHIRTVKREKASPQEMALANAQMLATRVGLPPQAVPLAVSQLPVAGATFGGLVGGPPGAGLGGIAGAGLQQLATRGLGLTPPQSMVGSMIGVDPNSPAGRNLQMLESGGVGLGGELVGPALKWGSKGFMRMAGMLTPESAQVAVREGISMTKAGLAKLMGKMRVATQGAYDLTLKAGMGKGGLRFQTADIATDVAKELAAEFPDLALSGTPTALSPTGTVIPATGEYAKLLELTESFQRSHPGLMTPAELHRIKQTSDQLAKGVYQKLENGKWVNVGDPLTQRWHKAVADWARERLGGKALPDGTRIGGIPGYAEKEQLASELIRLKSEAWKTAAKGERGGLGATVSSRMPSYPLGRMAAQMGTGAAIGGGYSASHAGDWERAAILGALIGGVGGSPQFLSMISMALANPALARMMGLGIREAGTALQNP